jgi:Protein of unknown function (DUF3800)
MTTTLETFSDYIVYVDESGDHSMGAVYESYPLFVLAFCIFRKDEYLREVVPAFQALKFKYFGHDSVVLHEREIRKATGPFKILLNPNVRTEFMRDLTEVIRAAPFGVVTAAIDKRRYSELPKKSAAELPATSNIYHLALGFCLDHLDRWWGNKEQHHTMHVVFEARGKVEDQELELEFRRSCDRMKKPFEPVFLSKASNSPGLQLADLIARPIGTHVLHPDQENRAYSLIRTKFVGQGEAGALGLKIFP